MTIDIFVAILNIKFLLSPLFSADSLNCFEQAGPHEDITRIDCQMHNACQKISDSKSKAAFHLVSNWSESQFSAAFKVRWGVVISLLHFKYSLKYASFIEAV